MNPSPLFLAIALVVVSGFVLAGMDSLAKELTKTFSVLQVTWARYFFHAIFVVILFRLQGHRDFLIPNAPKIQILRGLCMVGITSSLYYAIQFISLAEATAIMYLSPVLITLLAGIFLGEKIGKPHLFAVVLGFIGILIITKPGFQTFNPAMFIALLAAFMLALYFLLTSKVKHIDNARASLFYSSIIGAIGLTLLLPLAWSRPNLTQLLLLILMGALGATGHFLLIKAYSLISAATLSPYLNTQLIAATIFSVFVFGDVLSWNFFAGTGLIIAAGLYLWFYERYVKR
ncbi:MAG TPA: DMT family transporter [Leucothrix mucor]|nr:DMT family transporter [Leucothrix mucor]